MASPRRRAAVAAGSRPRHALLLLAAAVLPTGAAAGIWSATFGAPAAQKHATDELNEDNIAAHLKEHPVTAILFYAPWCFYSQQVMPAWDLAGQKLALHDPPIALAKIDTHRFGSIGDKYGVNAFPTMKLFVDGAVFDYDSHAGRGWQQIVKWVNRHIDRDHVLKQVEDIDHYLHDNDLNVIGLFPDGYDYNHSNFARASRHFDDVIFAEARGTEISHGIAEHLSKHASLVCETIDMGSSHENKREVTLPRKGMHCSDQPRNPQRPDWGDAFATAVALDKLTVTRTDEKGGWQQHLQLRCCNDENDSTVKQKFKVEPPSIVMFMPHDERFAIYDGDMQDIHALDRWITARRTPMIMHLTPDTAEKIMDSGPEKTPVLFMISREPQPKLEQELRLAAQQMRGRVLVCLSGTSSQIERRLADVAGIEDDGERPVITLIEAHSGNGPTHTARKFRMPEADLTSKAVIKFITDYEEGTLTPWLRSEPEPSPQDFHQGDVGVVVGTSFTKISQDEKKDVLVDFYAPWCGHCRKFEPQYKQLAKKLKHVKSLKIMKIDATRNEVEGMQIMGFPTIMLFPAGKAPKRQIMYQGNRDPDAIVRWLKEHSTVKFEETPPAVPQAAADPVEQGLLDPSEEDL